MTGGMKRSAAALMALVFAVLVSPSPARAEMFTSAEFLKWDHDSQGYYFRTSIGMAGLIAKQNDPAQGDCIDRWYFLNEKNAHAQIVAAMKRFPQIHPRGVVLAVIEKNCQALKYPTR